MTDPVRLRQCFWMRWRRVPPYIFWRRNQNLVERAEYFHPEPFAFRPTCLECQIDTLPDEIDFFVVAHDFQVDLWMLLNKCRRDRA
ncbi:hypothetical protein WS68_23540 [Burkholderia sp. TSV86]|nr:hypothetical protein WS68_23540 [Burkholderia sp. TSV86]